VGFVGKKKHGNKYSLAYFEKVVNLMTQKEEALNHMCFVKPIYIFIFTHYSLHIENNIASKKLCDEVRK